MIAAIMVACANGGGGPAIRSGQKFPASGYAAYQIAETLRRIEPVKLEPGKVKR